MKSVVYQSTKYDGSINHHWQAELEYQHDNLVILYTPPGTPCGGRVPGVFAEPFHTYFWHDRWFNVDQTLSGQQDSLRHYINIGTPAVFRDGSVSYIDLDLDFHLDNDWNLRLTDEAEYEARSAAFHYPPDLQRNVDKALSEVRALVSQRAWPFASCLTSERLRIRPFHWQDLARLDQWQGEYGPFDDPWYVPPPGSGERREWFAHYVNGSICRLYALETRQGELIGHLSLREIVLGAQARLGIGFAPLATSRGYGTESMTAFLPYYFETLGFQRMVLDVAASNLRAIRLYEKLGFRRFAEHYRSAGDERQWRILDDPAHAPLRRFFRRTAWGVQQLHFDMALARDEWRLWAAATGQMMRFEG